MHWIWQFIVLHRSTASFVFTVFLSLCMISVGEPKQQNIAKTLTLTLFSPAQFVIGTFYQFSNIFNENKVLREKIVTVELENAAFRKNLDIADVEEIKENVLSRYEIVPAEIIAREPSFFYRTAIINVGSNQGIKTSMPVISSDGVVGKVISVQPLTSQIQLLHAPDEYISVEHEKTGAVGILASKNDARLYTDIRSIDLVDSGDLFVTTGLGGIYPGGLKVGIAENINKPKGGEILKRVYIKSAVDYDRLRNVFVVKSDPQWEAIKDEILKYDENKKDG